MIKRVRFVLLEVFLLCVALNIRAQVNLAPGGSFTQNFNSFTSSVVDLPTGWKIASDASTARTINTSYTSALVRAGNTMSLTSCTGIPGGTYATRNTTSSGTGGSDYAPGFLTSSGVTNGDLYLAITNNGSSSIGSFTITYSAEKYRNSSNASGHTVTMYAATSASATGGSWTALGASFNTSFTSDGNTNCPVSATPGATTNIPNATNIISSQTYTPGTPLAVGSTIYLAWNFCTTSGSTYTNSPLIGIDDVTISATAASSTPTVNLSISSSSGSEGSATTYTLTATASSAVSGAQTVTVATPTGTGIAAGDFSNIAFPATITVANGATTGTATFTVNDDATYECSETATFAISSPSSGMTLGSTTTQAFTITDNDLPTVNLSISGSSGSEGSATTYTITATSSAAVIGSQTVSVALSGTGLTTGDFTGVTFPVTITITNGATSGSTASFSVVDDATYESTENATFTMSSPSSCIALGSTTTQAFTITDNDLPNVNLSISASSGSEGSATTYTLTATSSAAVSGAQTVSVALSGTGLANGDFTGLTFPVTINIADGATSGSTSTFSVNNDATYECTESATFTMSVTSGGISAGTTTTQNFSITDNDFPTVNLSISGSSGSEGSSTTYTLTATSSAAVIGAQTVSVALSGTGLTTGDFTGVTFPVTITIANGATSGSTSTFTVTDDVTVEGTENATFTMSSPSSCISLGSTTTQAFSISDNDVGPCLSESFTSTTFAPTGWAATGVSRSTSAADYVTSPAGASFSSNTGTLSTSSIAYPTNLTFYLGRSSSTSPNKTLYVEVSTVSQAGPFTTVATYDHNNVPVSSYNQYTVSLASYTVNPTVWIQFEKSSSTASPWRLDDVSVSCGTACTAPSVNTPSTTPVVCFGDGNGSITVSATGGTSPYTYSKDGGATYQSSNVFSAVTAGTYSVRVKGTGGCESLPTSVTVSGPTATLVASVSVSNNHTYVCTGTSNTFTATPTNGGSPSYQWKVNGSNVGTNSSQYTAAANTLSSGDLVTVVMTPTGCGLPSPVTSNALMAQGLTSTPTTVWTENFGTADVIDIGNYSSAANTGFDFISGGTPIPDVKTTTVSPGGGANVYMGASGFLDRYFTISGISTSSAYPNKLSFYFYNPTTTVASPNFRIEYSTDGTNFTEINYGTISTSAWSLVSINDALPQAANVWLRFTSNLQGAVNIRLDDIKLEKFDFSTPAIAVSPSATFCGSGTATLTATPNSVSSISWNNGTYFNPDNPTIFNPTTDALTADRTFTATLTDAFGCTATASQTITVTASPTVKTVTVSSGGSYCSGGTGLSIGLTTSAQSSVTYELFLGSTSVTTVTGTTSSTNLFPSQTGAGNYTIVGSANGCSATMSGSATITVNPLPTTYNVTGTGSYCIGGSGVAVGLSGSQANTSYQLQFNGSNLGSAVTNPSFGNQTVGGTYTVIATNTSNTPNCSVTMSGSAVVTVNPKASVQLGSSTPIFMEGFSASLPSGWTINTPSGSQYNWGFEQFNPTSSGYYTGASGGYCAMTAQGQAGANSSSISQLISPSIDITGYSNISVIWGARKTSSYTGSGTFYFSTNNGSSWTQALYNDVASNATWAFVNAGAPVSLALPAGATSLKLRWDGLASTISPNYRIDDIAVYGLEDVTTCPLFSTAVVAYASSANSTGYSLSAGSPALAGFSTQTGTLSGSGGTLNISIPAGSAEGTYNFTLALSNANSCNSTYTIPVTIDNDACVYQWTGSSTVNSNWGTTSNWVSNLVPPNSCLSEVLIPSGTPRNPTLTADVNIGTITLGDSKTIDVQSFTLNVCGDWIGGTSVASTVTGTGRVILNGTSVVQQLSGKSSFQTLRLNNSYGAQMQSGANFEIYKVLELQSGALNINGQTMTLRSQSVSNYAYLNKFSSGFNGSVSGNLTAQLSIPSSGTYQHFVGSPVAATLSQFNASGTAGYVTPYFVGTLCDESRNGGGPYGNVFKWEENKPLTAPGGACPLYGWNVQTSGAAVGGQGYSVYLSSGTFSITGNPNQQDIYQITGLANTGYSLGTVQNPSTITYTSGWHLLANPYLAPYNMLSSMTGDPQNTGNFDDLMVWVASGRFSGTYQSLVSGTFNGHMLAPFQGVMVHRGDGSTAATAQSSTLFQFSKSYETAATTLPQITRLMSQNALEISIAGNGYEDITYVEFNNATTSRFDIGYDSRKMISSLGQPTVYTLLNGEMMSSNINRSIDEVSVIPLSVAAGTNGNFQFTFDGLSSFDPSSYMYLEDKVTGINQDLRSNNIYNFNMNQADDHDRFVLHFTPAAKVNTIDASCSAAGVIQIEQPGIADWQYTISSSTGSPVGSGNLNIANPVSLSVAPGNYILTLTDLHGYSAIKNIEVDGVEPIAAIFLSSSDVAEVEEPISFSGNSPNAVTYSWDFGDGTGSNQQLTISHQYQQEGVYTVSFTVTNAYGCSSTTSQLITVTAGTVSGLGTQNEKKDLRIWSNRNKIFVDFGNRRNAGSIIEIFNILGQQIAYEHFDKSGIFSKEIRNSELGYVMVRIKNESEIRTRKLFITNK